MLKLTFVMVCSIVIPNLISAQIPAGYYDSATGSGFTLKTQLHNIIKGHTVVSYSALWTAYASTDIEPVDGFIYDMYSENPGGADPYNFTLAVNQCGSYSIEGDCYNREHSFPKSWFGGAILPMNTDIHHIVPTDGKVNGYRSNYPFGETNVPTITSANGSKVGPSVTPGYSGTVFEPLDEYKGDFARIYFYMATRYEDIITGWPGSVMTNGTSDTVYTAWAVDMLLDWHDNDPVSQKELNRNDSIYTNVQANRNPFVDHPEWVKCIWSDSLIWNGSVDVAWKDGDNWVQDVIPSQHNVVTIPGTGTAPTQPTISTNDTECKELIIDADNGAEVTITGVGVLTIHKP